MFLIKLQAIPALFLMLGLVPLGDSVRAEKRGKDGEFITKAGKYTLYDGQLTIKVARQEGGTIRWSVLKAFKDDRNTKMEDTVKEPPVREKSPWFILPASADAVWIYDGDKGMMVLEYSTPGGVAGSSSTYGSLPSGWNDLLKKHPPQILLERLPPALRPPGKGDK